MDLGQAKQIREAELETFSVSDGRAAKLQLASVLEPASSFSLLVPTWVQTPFHRNDHMVLLLTRAARSIGVPDHLVVAPRRVYKPNLTTSSYEQPRHHHHHHQNRPSSPSCHQSTNIIVFISPTFQEAVTSPKTKSLLEKTESN